MLAGMKDLKLEIWRSQMFRGMTDVKHEIWAPLLTALEQIVDATAAVPIDAQIKHSLSYVPSISDQFQVMYQQRHPVVWTALQEALGARYLAARIAAEEDAKRRRLASFKATMARKKAASEAAASRAR